LQRPLTKQGLDDVEKPDPEKVWIMPRSEFM